MQKPPIKFSGLVGRVATSGTPFGVKKVSEYKDYDPSIDGIDGEDPGPMMLTPVYDDTENTFAVIKLCSGAGGEKKQFTQQDFNFVDTMSLVAYNSIKRSEMFEDVKCAQERTNAALAISKAVSSEAETSKIIPKITKVAKEVLKADKVSVFLVNSRNPEELIVETSNDVRGTTISIHTGIAGSVATTGETVNLWDACEDKRFNNTMDSKLMAFCFSLIMASSDIYNIYVYSFNFGFINQALSGYKTKQILCMAIPDNEHNVIGVIQAINKTGDTVFTLEDEGMLQYVCENAGMALMKGRYGKTYFFTIISVPTILIGY